MLAKPSSYCSPIIFSQFTSRPNALPMKFDSPDMVQVTSVRRPAGLKVNSTSLVALNGRSKSSLMRISSLGRLSTMVMLPAPDFLPNHANFAPRPLEGPSNVLLAPGSILAQGDQASQLWKLLTCAKIASAGAFIVAD